MRNRLAQIRFPDATFFKGELNLYGGNENFAKGVVQLKRVYNKSGEAEIWLMPFTGFFRASHNLQVIRVHWQTNVSADLWRKMEGVPGKWPEGTTYGFTLPKLCLWRDGQLVTYALDLRPTGFRALKPTKAIKLGIKEEPGWQYYISSAGVCRVGISVNNLADTEVVHDCSEAIAWLGKEGKIEGRNLILDADGDVAFKIVPGEDPRDWLV